MPKPRILVFSTAYFPHVGGAEVAIREIAARIGSVYDFDLICAKYTDLPSEERIDEVNVYRVGWGIRILDKLASPFLGARLALSLGKKRPYDAYWAMMATYGSGGAYLANILQRRKVPIVLTLQEGDPPEYLRRKWFGLVGVSWRLALMRSKAVTVISTYLGNLAREFGYAGEPVLIPNGVDVSRFAKIFEAKELEEVRASLRKKEGDVYLVTTSRLVHKNAVDDVIRALPLLPSNVSFLIYGVGPDEGTLKALAKELDVTERARFMGQASHQDLPSILAACDIFIRPSRSEGMGNSFIEAMAAGLPVIATRVGGIPDFLREGETGWTVSVDAPEEIVRAVERILVNPEEVARITTAAKALALREYDWDLIASRMKALFGRLVG